MVGPQLALRGHTVEFLNVRPPLSEFPRLYPPPNDLHKSKHIKKKPATDNKSLSFFFSVKMGFSQKLKASTGALDAYAHAPHANLTPCAAHPAEADPLERLEAEWRGPALNTHTPEHRVAPPGPAQLPNPPPQSISPTASGIAGKSRAHPSFLCPRAPPLPS